ncbi:MAG TPA: MOSC N-terminal beta barrel domain-containing protein [Ktedonobacterales bacterium]
MSLPLEGPRLAGKVATLWRYPVKSMLGEELNASEVNTWGLLGDRAYALLDTATGKIASAKNPRKWPQLFDFRAAFLDLPRLDAPLPPVRITLPDGTPVTSEQGDLHQILSRALNRAVTLEAAEHSRWAIGEQSSAPKATTAEAYWPDMEGLVARDTVTEFELPEGTFFDGAVVNVLTTATLERLRELYPAGRFEVRRFRPNVVVETDASTKDFVENAWVGRTLAIGDTVRLSITRPCLRCVMTTLPQADLPRDHGILRAVAQHNAAYAGVYAAVVQGGTIRRGDTVRLG